jgi:hypothetical protein
MVEYGTYITAIGCADINRIRRYIVWDNDSTIKHTIYRVIKKSLCTWWLQYIIRCTETFWSLCIKYVRTGHRSKVWVIHKENPTRCNRVSKCYFIFIWSSTCFGRNTAHHQEPKTALAASDFAYVEGCWTWRSPETCWASYKYEIKFWYTVASCWIFFVNYTMMHGSTTHQVYKV